MIDIDRAFAREFDGMTIDHVPLDSLLEARQRLVTGIRSRLTGTAADFLLSVHDGEPKCDLTGLPSAADLTAIRWKLMNIDRLKTQSAKKHAEQRADLEAALNNG